MGFREPNAGSAHRKFWEHIKAGGRVWRNDPQNQIQEWIDLERLGGDPNEIQRFGYNNLSIPEEELAAGLVRGFPPAVLVPAEKVKSILARQGESVGEDAIGYYETLEALAERGRGSKCWSQGQTFVYAEAPDRFLILYQCAPASCEMMTLSQAGFHDVVTAYRYEQAELVSQLRGYLDTPKPQGPKRPTDPGMGM